MCRGAGRDQHRAAGRHTDRPPEASRGGPGRGGRDAARRAPRGRVTARRSAQPAGLRLPPRAPAGAASARAEALCPPGPPTPSGLRPSPKPRPTPPAPSTPPRPRSPGGAGPGRGLHRGRGVGPGPRGLVRDAGRRRMLGLRALVKAGSGPGGLSAAWTCPSHAARPPPPSRISQNHCTEDAVLNYWADLYLGRRPL